MPEKVAADRNLVEVVGISLLEAGNSVLQDITFTQREFQKLVIVGETGSGKSTLLQTLAGLVQPSAGAVHFAQKRVIGPQEQLVPGHPGIAYLSQQFELPRFLRVEQVLRYANQLPAAAAATLYELCRIEYLLPRRTEHLSGGERQRVALARLLLAAPRLLLLDEPFSNLDSFHKNILKAVIRDLSETWQITCTLISHDPLDTLSWADEILVLRAGKMIQSGTPAQIYRQPVDEYTAGLFGSYNLIPAARAPALFPLGAIKQNKKNILLRPEHFKIVAAGSSGLTGKVTNVTFFGAYYEIEVLLAEIRITVKTTAPHFKKGDTAYLAVSADDGWYV